MGHCAVNILDVYNKVCAKKVHIKGPSNVFKLSKQMGFVQIEMFL